MNCGPPGSSVHGDSPWFSVQAPLSMGILQARLLEWLANPPPGDLLIQGSNRCLLSLLNWQVGSLSLTTWEAQAAVHRVAKNWTWLCDWTATVFTFIVELVSIIWPRQILQLSHAFKRILHLFAFYSASSTQQCTIFNFDIVFNSKNFKNVF